MQDVFGWISLRWIDPESQRQYPRRDYAKSRGNRGHPGGSMLAGRTLEAWQVAHRVDLRGWQTWGCAWIQRRGPDAVEERRGEGKAEPRLERENTTACRLAGLASSNPQPRNSRAGIP